MILTTYFIRTVLVLLDLLASQSFAQEDPSNVAQWFKERIQRIQMEQNFENILIIRRNPKDCFLENLPNILEQPIWLSGDNNTFDLKQKFNSEVLALVCQQKQFDILQLKSLAINLNNIRHTRIIILAKDFSQPQDLYEPLMRYSPYPDYQVTVQTFQNATDIFRKYWLNFRGKILYTLPDQYEPRTVLYKDLDGGNKISGYVAKLIQLYAKRYNASLQFLFPLKIGQIIHSNAMKKFSENRTLDLPMSITTIENLQTSHEVSYPVEMNSLLTMVPATGSISTENIYLIILGKKLIIVLIFMIFSFSVLITIADILPGILGQSYVLHTQPKPAQKFVYLSIFVLGLTLNTLYAAHLKTLITSHPSLRAIMSFDDLRNMNLNILVDEIDVNLTDIIRGRQVLDKIRDLMKMTDTATFRSHRSNLNTSYAYTVPSPIWRCFEEQQHFFTRKLFYAPKSMLILEMTHSGIPLQKNSVLKESLDQYIYQVHAAGFLKYWYANTFRDMVSAKKIAITDRSEIEKFNNLRIQDLYWIWILIGCGYMLSTIAFLVELCLSFIKSKLREI
ncbi:uncharacterized protein LOC119674205 [Teleopsis dalmanni]|uniref:uncharacterized protein LOC119674205 n=1 Tax=Teleopsis dalmanni TaxID=139649 RepID=UPI0018CF5C5C|nr:uncharacterized protein LOC119674205 [Teleopsis dalmanni]